MFLKPETLEELTGKIKRGAQVRALQSMGILYEIRPDGYPLVLEDYIKNRLGGSKESDRKEVEPDWDAI